MFSKELEEVIEAALADGVLTDKERAVLHKRAQAEGVDPDELDVVIDGRLAKTKKQEDWLRSIPPKTIDSNKVGIVKKCPNCGAPYHPGTGKCPECGHLFQEMGGNSSAQRLAEGVQRILNDSNNKENIISQTFGVSLGLDKLKKVEQYVLNFPIPNTKDDMLEFITSLDSKLKMIDSSDLQSVYKAKYKEVIKKAKIMFPDDEQLSEAIAMTNKFSLSTLTRVQKGCIIVLVFIIMWFVLIVWSLLSFQPGIYD
ncbi:MAG: hypothetical protein II453_20640, partial [Alphaproteobacteria bacterium]|nr:hypothetical protein [Alphaproteobacteria bacterium]